MTALEKYNNVFVEVFAVEVSALTNDFSKDTVAEWDSVHQLNIVVCLEETFDIMFDPEDIMGLNSYENGKVLLRKYNIELQFFSKTFQVVFFRKEHDVIVKFVYYGEG